MAAFKTTNENETRRSPRRVFQRAIGLLHDGHYELAQAIQISEAGMSFVSTSRLAVGIRLVVTLAIPGRGSLVLQGVLASERDPVGKMRSYGLQFAPLDLHQRRLVRSYVSAKTQAEAEVESAVEDD